MRRKRNKKLDRPRRPVWRNWLAEPIPGNHLRIVPHSLSEKCRRARPKIFKVSEEYIDASSLLEVVHVVVPESRGRGATICRVKAIPVIRREPIGYESP